jgi:Cu/Ag efflux protein CusF
MTTKFLLAATAIGATATLAACSPKPAADISTASSESPAAVMSDISGMAGMSDMSGMAMEPAAMTGKGIGDVTAIDSKAGTVTIKHEAIPEVSWPAMTMTFKASPASLLSGLRVGEKVAFDVSVKGSDAEVTAIQPK